MKKLTVGVAVAANVYELGAEKSPEYQAQLTENLKRNNIEFVEAGKTIMDSADALEVVEEFNKKGIDLLLLVHSNWVMDNVDYIIYNKINCPTVFLSVPGITTFSMACVQHFSSACDRSGLFYRQINTALDSDETAASIKTILNGVAGAKTISNAVIGLIGPRQTWRTSGLQDVTHDEWDLTETLGAVTVHIDQPEWEEEISKVADDDAKAILDKVKNDKRIEIKVTDEHLLTSCKSYLAIKKLIAKYHLTCAAAECYPNFGGMSNLTACLLADEGFVLDTEGDITHALVMSALNEMDGKACVLAEWGTCDDKNDIVYLTHEGSSALSRMPETSKAVINEAGDGIMIGYLLTGNEDVTLVDFSGQSGIYKTVCANVNLTSCPKEMFEENCERLLVAIKAPFGPTEFYNACVATGSDHHYLIKQGDLAESVSVMSDLLGIINVTL